MTAPAALAHTRRPLMAQLETKSKVARLLPFAIVLMSLALLLFSLAAMPARVVPWPWVMRGLDHRRADLAFLGIVALLVMAGLFLAG